MLLEPLMEYRATKQILGHPQDPVLRAFFGADDLASGMSIDENTALNYSAVWCATRVLSSTAAMLPKKVYRRLKGGGKEEATDNRMYRIVHRRPNYEMTAMMFGLPLVQQQVNGGNSYAELERNNRGEIINQWPIHCSRVCPYRGPDGVLRYEIKNNDGTTGYLDQQDVLHFPNIITSDGITGRGVIQHARESIGMGLATERHGASFFGNGARPGVIVKHPQRMSDEARKNFRREWNELYQGPGNAHKVALLAEGADITELGASQRDSQFLETREHNVNEFARWYGVPPHLLYDLRRATFSNIDAQEIEYVTFSLLPLLVIHEQEYTRKLFTEEEQDEYFVEHKLDALLRGDALARAQALQIQLQNGAINIDEWRAVENRNPLPDGSGQKHFIQLNMTTTEKAGQEPVAPTVKQDVERIEAKQDETDKTAKESYQLIGNVFTAITALAEHSKEFREEMSRVAGDVSTGVALSRENHKVIEDGFADTKSVISTGMTETAAAIGGVNENLDAKCDAIAAGCRQDGEQREQLFQVCSVEFHDCLRGLMKTEQNDLRKHARRRKSDLHSLNAFAEKLYRTQAIKLERELAKVQRWWVVCGAGPQWSAKDVAVEFVEESRRLLGDAISEAASNPKNHARTQEEKHSLVKETVINCVSQWEARPRNFTNRFIRKADEQCVA